MLYVILARQGHRVSLRDGHTMGPTPPVLYSIDRGYDPTGSPVFWSIVGGWDAKTDPPKACPLPDAFNLTGTRVRADEAAAVTGCPGPRAEKLLYALTRAADHTDVYLYPS